MEKTERLDDVVKTEKRYNFTVVCDDLSFFEREDNMRHYVVCISCGFVPLLMIDRDTKFLDLHCKCGSVAIYSSFAEEEILVMIRDAKESLNFDL